MTRFSCNLVGYIQAVFIESTQKFLLFFDFLGIFLFFFPNVANSLITNFIVTRSIGISIFILSFFVANFRVYQGLCFDGADIRLHVIEQYLNPSASDRSPFLNIKGNPSGFNHQGLPDWVSLYAVIELSNIGLEEGKCKYEFDDKRIKFPKIFNLIQINKEFKPLSTISARSTSSSLLFFDLSLNTQDPHYFAREIGILVKSKAKYAVVIRYWTKRVDGETKKRNLKIYGDFKYFYEKIQEYWEDNGFNELARIARDN